MCVIVIKQIFTNNVVYHTFSQHTHTTKLKLKDFVETHNVFQHFIFLNPFKSPTIPKPKDIMHNKGLSQRSLL